MQEQKPVRRGVYILPNLFTTASLFTGFLAMLLAVQGNIEGSALAILFSALMDGLDGKVARLTNTASEFGIQYDSLADLVAFGVAPAFTSWMWVLEGYGKLGIGVGFLYVACTALRLARFNVCVTTVSKKFFVGLPCPAAGCAVAMFILFSSYLPSWLEARTPFLGLFVTFVMALLMVSRVRYFSFKEYGFLKTHAFSSMISALLVFVLILSQPVVFGFLLGALYILSRLHLHYSAPPQPAAPREPYAELMVDGALIQGREGNLIRAVPCPSLLHMRSFLRETAIKPYSCKKPHRAAPEL